jgi:sugar phosphate permease
VSQSQSYADLNMSDPTRRALRFARVVPLAFITYSLAYLDRVNWGYAESGGMKQTLGISAQLAWFTATAFFIGYFLFQIPGAGYAAHRSAKRIIFWALLLWGGLSVLTGLVKSVPLLITVRILLGMVEGVVFPSLLVFLTHWFTKPERSRANTLLILGNPLTVTWASALSGYIIEYFTRHPIGRLTGWQMMFVVEGLPSVAWAFLWLLLADDMPTDARWLSRDQAVAIQEALDQEQRSIPTMSNYLVAFKDTRVLLLCGQFLTWSVGIYGFVMWLPTIVKEGSQRGVGQAGLLTAIPYLLSCIVMFTVSAVSDRRLLRKPFVWPPLLLGALALYGSYLAGPSHFGLAFLGLIVAGICMYAPYGPFWAMVAEMVPRNVVGESMALINTAGALGGGIGTYGVARMKDAVGLGPAFIFMAAALLASGVFTLLVRVRSFHPAGAFPVVIGPVAD